MYEITFKYADQYSNWEWRTQHCIMSSIDECIKVYGLGCGCEYEIINVEKIGD